MTVSSRPRAWASHSNISQKNDLVMNSTEEIARYRAPETGTLYCSPTLQRRALYSYDFPAEKKKEKKWSIGSLFRRSKKKDESSSSEDEKKNFFRKRKSEAKKKPRLNFDHVVVNPRASHIYFEDSGILSDPTGGFNGRTAPKALEVVGATGANGSGESLSSRKSRKELTKARAVARRTLKGGSSSEEEESRSGSSLMVRSEENLQKHRDGSLNRKSRAARTERYLKRHSKDGENPYNYLRLSKSDVEHWKCSSSDTRSPSRSPIVPKMVQNHNSSLNALSTIPPHSGRFQVSNSTSNPSYKPPLSMNEYNARNKRCSSEVNINLDDIAKARSRNLSLIDSASLAKAKLSPPPPPPRDPNRLVFAENQRPTTYYFQQLRPNTYRSTSEDCIARDVPLSTAPTRSQRRRVEIRTNPEGFNYLTDKNPRSRKPIFIQDQDQDKNGTKKVLDFWRQKESLNNKVQSVVQPQIQSPQMFTSQTKLETKVFLPREASPFKPIEEPQSQDQVDDNRKSTNLEDALDELEAIYKSLRLGDEDLLERAEQREREAAEAKAKTVKVPEIKIKEKLPDRKQDDMAFRKLCKERASTISDPQAALAKLSYLLASPLHNSLDNVSTKSDPSEPDITFDDVVYRNVKHSNNLLKVIEPQPPFGIPLGPVAPAPSSDYLHAVPDRRYRRKPRKIPDVVQDDLAFRNLRKDSNKEPQLSAEDYRNNNLKKRRATRSLSANIGSIVNPCNNNNEFKTLTDIADAMEIARQVLREKDQKISNTRKAFLSDTDTLTLKNKYSKHLERQAERRSQFLNGMAQVRPPKESTPIPSLDKSPKSSNSSLDDLLNALAEEAKETTERITSELKMLSELKTRKRDKELDRKLEEIDAVSEHAKLCEKLLECVVDSAELVKNANSEDEEVKQIQEAKLEEANVVVTKDLEDEHDYENLVSDKELSVDEVAVDESKCVSPFEEHKAELIASFQELKEKADELQVGKKEEKTESIYDNVPKGEAAGEVGVASNLACCSSPTNTSCSCLDSLESLKSPKLVLASNRMVSRALRGGEREPSRGETKEAKKSAAWYRDPATLVACSYSIACVHQLASLDFVTVLGVLFAVISFLAAMFL